METIKTYNINGVEYEVYKAASGCYCVSVSRYGEEREDYNLGGYEKALEFILSYFECIE